VQSESVAADGCAFMYAKHLAFGSKSTFSEALSLFNPKPVILYDAVGGCPMNGRPVFVHGDEVCPEDHGHSLKYCIWEIGFARSVEEKMNWVRNYQNENITCEGMQCFE